MTPRKQMPIQNDPFHLPAHLLLQEKEAEFQEKLLNSSFYTMFASRSFCVLECLILLFSGLLYAFAFPQYSFDFYAWIGLVPLIWIVIRQRPLRALCYGWIWGMGFCAIAFFWMTDIHWLAWMGLSMVLAAFPAIASAIIAFSYRYFIADDNVLIQGYQAIHISFLKVGILRTILFSFLAACVWVATEYLRSYIFSGLPWNTLATSQWQNLYLLQLCEWTGFYGMSFFIFLVNMGCYYLVFSVLNYYRFGLNINLRVLVIALVLMCITVFTCSSNMSEMVHFSKPRKSETVHKLGVIQGNIEINWGKPFNDLAGVANRLFNYTLSLATNNKPEVIIWPETILPLTYKLDYGYQNLIQRLIKRTQIPMIIGTPDNQDGSHRNLALLIDKHGNIAGEYAKIHCVPFGEYIPGGMIVDYFFPGLRQFFLIDRDLTPGVSYAPLKVSSNLRIGINICFEDIFPYVSRNLTRNGADVLVTITNDGWYPTSDERFQHMANAIFRAVENRRYVVRTGNMARACLIDPAGRVVAWFNQNSQENIPFDAMEKGEGGVTFNIHLPQNKYFTFYTVYGDIFAQLCSLITILLVVSTWIRHYHLMSKINQKVTPEPIKIEID